MIVLDLRMPGTTGMELLERVRKDHPGEEESPRLPARPRVSTYFPPRSSGEVRISREEIVR